MTRIEEEKRVVDWMISIWAQKHPHDNCEDLRYYAFSRLDNCRFGENKPTCKLCPIHCYSKENREHIRMIMRYSGPRMLLYHPIAALRHLFRENFWSIGKKR